MQQKNLGKIRVASLNIVHSRFARRLSSRRRECDFQVVVRWDIQRSHGPCLLLSKRSYAARIARLGVLHIDIIPPAVIPKSTVESSVTSSSPYRFRHVTSGLHRASYDDYCGKPLFRSTARFQSVRTFCSKGIRSRITCAVLSTEPIISMFYLVDEC